MPEPTLHGERFTVRYVPLDEALAWLWPENPKRHDTEGIKASVRRYGFIDPPKFDAALGGIVYGNGRLRVLPAMRDDGEDLPRGVCADGDGRWYVPVGFGVDQESQSAAEALAVDHNNLTLLGGAFTTEDLSKLYEAEGYAEILRALLEAETMPVSIEPADLDDVLATLGRVPAFEPAGVESQSRLDSRNPVTCPNCRHEFTPS